MGRKSSAKGHASAAGPVGPSEPKRPLKTVLVVALAAGLVVIAGAAYWRQNAQASRQVAQVITPPAAALADVPEVKKRPRPQKNLPPLEFPAYPMGRPPEVVRAAYRFAAEHPEVLSYVPCFCGCEHNGHRGNHDCFVRARDITGDVIEWDPHGMDCTVCLDVATRSKQMHEAGASVKDIRAAIEKEWAARSTNHTPTPSAPGD